MATSYGSIRPLTPNFDAEIKSYYGKASVWDSGKHHYLFSYGKLTAEIVEGDAGHKVLVYNFLQEPDNSYAKKKHKAILRHVAEFLHEFGYSADTFDEVKEFMPPDEAAVSSPVELAFADAPAESPAEPVAEPAPVVLGNWILHTHPRNRHDTWFTCSECGNLAVADNGKDILTPFCPNCGKQMSVYSSKESPVEIPSAESVNDTNSTDLLPVSAEAANTAPNASAKTRYSRFTGWRNFKPANAKIRIENNNVVEVLINGKPHAINTLCYGKWAKRNTMCVSQLYFRHKLGRIMFTEIPAATAGA